VVVGGAQKLLPPAGAAGWVPTAASSSTSGSGSNSNWERKKGRARGNLRASGAWGEVALGREETVGIGRAGPAAKEHGGARSGRVERVTWIDPGTVISAFLSNNAN